MRPVTKELKQNVVGLGGLQVSSDAGDALVTYALGSCLAVTAYDPLRMVGGLLHLMLPSSATAPARAKASPGMFADTGIPVLLQRLYELGCVKSHLVVKVVGGGHLLGAPNFFDIGKSNCEAAQRVFDASGIAVTARDVGGTSSRTVEMHIHSGRLLVRSLGSEREL